MHPNHLPILALFLLLAACQSSKKTTAETETPEPVMEQVRRAAQEKYGKNVRMTYNPSRNLVAAQHEITTGKEGAPGTLAFTVYSLKTGKPTCSDAVPTGKLSWQDDFHLQVKIVPGALRESRIDGYGYVYHVLTGKRRVLER